MVGIPPPDIRQLNNRVAGGPAHDQPNHSAQLTGVRYFGLGNHQTVGRGTGIRVVVVIQAGFSSAHHVARWLSNADEFTHTGFAPLMIVEGQLNQPGNRWDAP